MNKLRQEKIKQHKLTIDNDKRNKLMPKILYFNKFIHSQPKPFSKNDYSSMPSTHIREKNILPKNTLKSFKTTPMNLVLDSSTRFIQFNISLVNEKSCLITNIA